MNSTSTFLFETMNFGCPEVVIAVAMTVLVMLSFMYLVLSLENNLSCNQVDEEQTDNETPAKLKPRRKKGSRAQRMHRRHQEHQGQKHGATKKLILILAFATTLWVNFAAVATIMVYHQSQDALAGPTTNQVTFSPVFEYASAIEQSFKQKVTPRFHLNSKAITELEGQALFQLSHGSENDTNTTCCDEDDLVCFTSSFVAQLYNTIGLWASSLTGHTARDASTIHNDPTNSETSSLSSIFEYATLVEQAYGQQVTPSSPAISMTESEALYKLLYGEDDATANGEQGQEQACSIGMEDCTCCEEDDLFCLGSSALSKCGRDLDKAYNHMTHFFSAGKARLSSAFSSAFDRDLATNVSEKTRQPTRGASMDTKLPTRSAVSDILRAPSTGAGKCRLSTVISFKMNQVCSSSALHNVFGKLTEVRIKQPFQPVSIDYQRCSVGLCL